MQLFEDGTRVWFFEPQCSDTCMTGLTCFNNCTSRRVLNLLETGFGGMVFTVWGR